MGPWVPFVPLPFGNLVFFFLSFSNVVYLILYMYVCSKISNKVGKTKQNKQSPPPLQSFYFAWIQQYFFAPAQQ